eukprot:COSAG02_NODE_18746_length_921_cov_1.332117_1_plen_39_part_10
MTSLILTIPSASRPMGAVVLGVFGLPPSNQDDPERGVLA